MAEHVLITGGAGFIGSHLCDELLARGYAVRVLDNLSPQVHGTLRRDPPSYLSGNVEFMYGDIRDAKAVGKALENIDAVFHFAAAVGVGQSMYEIRHYTSVNNYGTAVLLQNILKSNVRRIITASSMSIYGEGLYKRKNDGEPAVAERTPDQLRRGAWEPVGPGGGELEPIPTPEGKHPSIASLYALSKYDQERMVLMIGKAYNIDAVALRFFNVYGTRQSLSNPYTGVLAIFASRYLNNKPPIIYEDGLQKRDFVGVADVARACRLALETPAVSGRVFNIGSGTAYTIREAAAGIASALGKNGIDPVICGKYRVGDIRHCFADISSAREVLGYRPEIDFEKGMIECAQWLGNRIACDRVDKAHEELISRGLTI